MEVEKKKGRVEEGTKGQTKEKEMAGASDWGSFAI